MVTKIYIINYLYLIFICFFQFFQKKEYKELVYYILEWFNMFVNVVIYLQLINQDILNILIARSIRQWKNKRE